MGADGQVIVAVSIHVADAGTDHETVYFVAGGLRSLARQGHELIARLADGILLNFCNDEDRAHRSLLFLLANQ